VLFIDAAIGVDAGKEYGEQMDIASGFPMLHLVSFDANI